MDIPNFSDKEIVELLKQDLSEVLPECFTVLDGVLKFYKKVDPDVDISKPTLFKKVSRDALGKNKWPHNPGFSHVSDSSVPVAVGAPSQSDELQEAARYAGAGIVGPCVTPNEGVEIVIANLVSNPNIRHLILAGPDSGHRSGDVIERIGMFGKNAINWETGKVIDAMSITSPYLRKISQMENGEEILERFKNQVQVINLMIPKLTPEVLSLVIRLCIQEPANAFYFQRKTPVGEMDYYLYDMGAYEKDDEVVEPIVFTPKSPLTFGEAGYGTRVGTSIIASSIVDAVKQARDVVAEFGCFAKFESTIQGLDVLGLQVALSNWDTDLIPKGYSPEKHLIDEDQVADYLAKYARWVYLIPFSNVGFDPDSEVTIPVLSEPGSGGFDYVYGSQLSAWGWQTLKKDELAHILKLVKQFHAKFGGKLPDYDSILKFHEDLQKLDCYKERRVVDQLYEVGISGLRHNIGRNISPYRLYVSLQDPRYHISSDPTKLHPPCFKSFEWLPRFIDGNWQLDTIFQLRAHAEKAMPSNMWGGMEMARFCAHVVGIKLGTYLHWAACFQIYADDLDPELLARKKKESGYPD